MTMENYCVEFRVAFNMDLGCDVAITIVSCQHNHLSIIGKTMWLLFVATILHFNSAIITSHVGANGIFHTPVLGSKNNLRNLIR